ncbi:uncharacterized protein B0H18DRAFT_452067 [Fomitopsis serialis]|uniref:uncharacterized protein n=1 Tax=Fomitopsis serialis TaxID=139415 RepID=UPI00200899C5|nr:uncharacterized protein B0H18DRAFT_452067 [Neoantrodia serialis]KAH9923899.1 hypothetical protein B0H18DRAFT_452067 [Neoantrodia serialis]
MLHKRRRVQSDSIATRELTSESDHSRVAGANQGIARRIRRIHEYNATLMLDLIGILTFDERSLCTTAVPLQSSLRAVPWNKQWAEATGADVLAWFERSDHVSLVYSVAARNEITTSKNTGTNEGHDSQRYGLVFRPSFPTDMLSAPHASSPSIMHRYPVVAAPDHLHRIPNVAL